MDPVAIATLVVSVLALVVGGTWKLSTSEKSIRADMGDELARVRREFGETGAAIRQKIHEIELWSRDHYVLRPSFDVALGQVTNAIQAMDEKIETRLMRMESKIERTVQRED